VSSETAIGNPYSYGRPIQDPGGFYGREQQLHDIFEHIEKKECVNVVGERRSGKTSLLYRLESREEQVSRGADPKALFVYVDAEIIPQSPDGFFREVFTQVGLRYAHLQLQLPDTELAEQQVRLLFKDMQPYRLIVLVDEFECISQCEAFPPRFFVFLRGLSFCYDISFILSTHRRLFECCTPEVVTSPFPNIFKTVEVGPFAPEEYEHFVKDTSRRGGAPLQLVQEDVAKLAGYFPYLVQMACWHYYQVWTESGSLDEESRTEVRRRFDQEAAPHLRAVWSRYLSDEERDTLLHLLAGESSARPNVVWRLQKRGYIQDDHLASVALADYIRDQMQTVPASPAVAEGVPSAGLWVDAASGNLYLEGNRLEPPLTKHQYRLVKLLFENKGKICTPYMVVEAVWSEDYIDQVDDQRIAQLISRLRKRVEPEGRPWRHIVTVHGRGLTLGDG